MNTQMIDEPKRPITLRLAPYQREWLAGQAIKRLATEDKSTISFAEVIRQVLDQSIQAEQGRRKG
ncbi:MAG: hypothetical protein H7842_09965 [Gammaproteobacteria bacterium SHHR-1]